MQKSAMPWLLGILLTGASVAVLAQEAVPRPAGLVMDQGALMPTFTVWSPAMSGTREAPSPTRGYGWSQFRPSPGVPAGWTAADFDASNWVRQALPLALRDGSRLVYLAETAVRAPFYVDDPARVQGLKLALTFRGGMAVYLNGQEIARSFLPAGPLSQDTLADDYPEDAYAGDGPQFERRWDGALPTAQLRKGMNVLAIEVHRSTFRGTGKHAPRMATGALVQYQLVATPEGVATLAPARQGVQVWNASPVAEIDGDWQGDWTQALQPIRLVAPRNGAVSGQVVLGAATPLADVKATASALTLDGGAGTIPAAAVSVRYGARTSLVPGDAQPMRLAGYDALAEAPVAGERLQPVWITVQVPADAAPGQYQGTLTVSAKGLAATAVPVRLTVSPWSSPAPSAFTTHVGLIESPEAVATRYGVPLWSAEHWALIEASLKQLGKVGADGVFIPLIPNTHFGNTQTMVRWVKRGATYEPDYALLDRYLDLWLTHVGRPQYVCLNVWDFYLGGQGGSVGSVNGGGVMGKEVPVPVTVVDPATGAVSTLDTPPYGEPGSETFWQPVLDAIRDRLGKRGITPEQIILGHGADARPNKKQLAFWTKVAPYARWILRSHTPTPDINGTPVAFASSPDWTVPDRFTPGNRGWTADGYLNFSFPRDYSRGDSRIMIANGSPAFTYRRVAQGPVLAAGGRPCGFGGVGADFWPGGGPGSIAGWGHLGVDKAVTYVLIPGPKGALGTVRLEMLREGLQEAEACSLLMRALSAPEQRAKLGDDLAGRCQRALDDRCWIMDLGGMCQELFQSWGWQDKAVELYGLAAEVQAALAK